MTEHLTEAVLLLGGLRLTVYLEIVHGVAEGMHLESGSWLRWLSHVSEADREAALSG